MKKITAFIVTLALFLSMGSIIACAQQGERHIIILSAEETSDGSYSFSASVDGESVKEYDYTWHNDPSGDYDEVKDAPGVYYTGDEPEVDAGVYIAHDIVYYPLLPSDDFRKVKYDGETEWAYYYTSEEYSDYVFSTLPVHGESLPENMMHSEQEAFSNAVLHITQPGAYEIKGEWHGQIKIDLGEEASSDENARVTLILSGADITCTVAPAINFYSVYECDNEWEDSETHSYIADTSEAGASVVLSEGSVNNITGANVFRLLKTKFKSDENDNTDGAPAQKKYNKTDAAFYSYMSMNISGEGTLNINSSFEGLDSELHLTINGGNINIYSQDDGINVNEDSVSVLTFNGGTTHIYAGLGSEGDGIDSNGYLVINGGTLITTAKPQSDSGLDSDSGSYIFGGTVIALGSTMNGVSTPPDKNGQVSANFRFSSMQNSDEAVILTDTDNNIVFAYDPEKDSAASSNARTYQGAIISDSSLEKGKTYYLYIGGDVIGTSDNGIYTKANAEGFTSEAVRQSYTSMMDGADPMKGTPPQKPDGEQGTPPQKPDGEQGTPPQMPDGEQGTPPQMPDGEQGTPPQMPDGEQGTPPQMPDGEQGTPPQIPNGEQGTPPQLPGGEQGAPIQGEASDEFIMTDIVNNFSGVGDSSSSQSEKPGVFKRILNAVIGFFRNIGEFFRKLFTGELFKK